MSYHLTRTGREHVILERGRVAQSLRSERWDSLMFQFPNSSIQLPGYTYETDDPDGYVPKDEIVRFIEQAAANAQQSFKTAEEAADALLLLARSRRVADPHDQ